MASANTTPSPNTSSSRAVRVRGLVQGVGYRYACVQQARKLGISGWVRNRSDGSVEALLQGTQAALAQMCEWMRSGVRGARVDDIEVSQTAPSSSALERFEQRPTL